MKKSLLLFFFISCFTCLQAQSNFPAADSILNANLKSVFHNKVICMVKHNDSLIYYYTQGGDSLTQGGIASVSKTLSAALMLRLVQEGTITLDDSLAEYYPSSVNVGKGGTTLRELFAHVSGIDGNTNYNADASINLQQSADSIIANDSLIYTPIGAKFSYTGEDQQVAGAAAELAAGINWDSLFSEKIARPLGLTTAYFANTTPTNPRIAGGIKTDAADMLRFGEFVLHNGRSQDGVQVVDSALMQQLWMDQTHHAVQYNSPYPSHPANNNPYNADTIYYGVGTWLDIYNPVQHYQEQISADGAYGGAIWINRCTNVVGVFLTFFPSTYLTTFPPEEQVMDVIRNAVPFNCYIATPVKEIKSDDESGMVYPNPAQQQFTVTAGTQPFDIQVTDITGRSLYDGNNIAGRTEIDCSSFANGIYFVRFMLKGNNIVNRKVVIAR